MRQARSGNQPVRGGAGARGPAGEASIDAMFRVFADRTRLRILRLLQDGPLCVGDLVEILRAPQPTVSRHLTYLRRSGFVKTQQHGLWVFYELAPPRNTVHGKLLDCLVTCNSLLAEGKADTVRARKLRRSGGGCPEGRRLMEQCQRRTSR